MKKTIRKLLALLVVVAMSSGGAWAQTFSGGSGSLTDPYQIKTIDDMTALATAVNGGNDYEGVYFKLMNDITYGSTDAYTIVGAGVQFKGNFNGNGKTISGIRYTTTTVSKIGLFGEISAASITNLTVSDCWFTNISGCTNAAVVIGNSEQYSTIDQITVKDCKVIVDNGYAAGVVAYVAGSVTNCTVLRTTISVKDSGVLYGKAGGVLGFNDYNYPQTGLLVQDCTIEAEYAGGILAQCGGNCLENDVVEDCTITGKSGAAGIGPKIDYWYPMGNNNEVAGNTTITVAAGGNAGALFSNVSGWGENNYYAKEVKVIIGSTTYQGDTPRGYYDGSPVADYTTNNGAKVDDFWKINVVASPASGGTVSSSRGWARNNSSTTVTVTATPADGFNFLGWTSTDVTLAAASAETTTFTKALTSAVTVTANFGAGLALKSSLTNATVRFWDGGTTVPTVESIASCTDANKITSYDNSSASEDRYIIVYIEPTADYWTDPTLLMAMEAAGSLARGRAPSLDLGRKLTLLKVGTYSDGSNTLDRHDGAGWYYYKLPKEHNVAAGYTSSVIDGYVVRKFDFSFDTKTSADEVSLKTIGNDKVITITHGTEDDWTAEITLDKLSFPFTGEGDAPVFTNVKVKNGSTTMLTLTKAADIAEQLLEPMKNTVIGSINQVSTNAASPYTWFKKYNATSDNYYYVVNVDEPLYYDITVPFTVADESAEKGTAENPWLIRTADELNLLAKCVNVGQYTFDGKFLQQTADIDMSEINDAAGKNDFLPIGNENIPFSGTFDGNSKTISKLTLNPAVGDLVLDNSGIIIGLFGFITPKTYPAPNLPTIKNVKLSNCAFTSTITTDQLSIGSIVGYLNFGNIINCSVNECTVSASVGEFDVAVGGIAGFSDPNATISDCTVASCTISGAGEKGTVGGVVGLIEGSSMVVTARSIHNTRGVSGVRMKAPASVSVSGNRVKSTAEKKTAITGGCAGAIIGKLDLSSSTEDQILSDNLYDYNVEVTQGTTAHKAYTKRGINIKNGTTYSLTDYETNNGAMMEIYPVTLSVTPITGYSPTLQIDADPSTTDIEDLVAGTTCYKIVSGVPSLAAGDVKTLVIAPTITRTNDGRTFYAELTALTLNDGTTDTDLLGALSFTMPSAAVTIAATYSEADWFTIDTNKKEWMSFYHEWTDASGAPANYTVSDGSGTGKTIKALTITGIDVMKCSYDIADLGGVSFSGVPTLFNSDGSLPALLRFDPVADKTAPQYDETHFKGVATTGEGDLSGFANVYVLNAIGDFLLAYDKNDPLAIHRCYIYLGNIAVVAPARLHINTENTGIDDIVIDGDSSNEWFSLDGRRLDGRPTRAGIYINNGKKVVIK